MPELEERIAQFEHMAQEDPENEMAHFSLGNAYLQAERYGDAAERFLQCLKINPEMSKAYQLAGQALIDADRREQAVEVLKNGYKIAAKKGDVMPRDAIAASLNNIDEQPPELSDEEKGDAEQLAESGAFICKRTGRPGTQLEEPPFRGEVGQWIYENISAETWQEWIGQGTKVINELRLDLSREDHQDIYDQHMREFLGIDELMPEQSKQ